MLLRVFIKNCALSFSLILSRTLFQTLQTWICLSSSVNKPLRNISVSSSTFLSPSARISSFPSTTSISKMETVNPAVVAYLNPWSFILSRTDEVFGFPRRSYLWKISLIIFPRSPFLNGKSNGREAISSLMLVPFLTKKAETSPDKALPETSFKYGKSDGKMRLKITLPTEVMR